MASSPAGPPTPGGMSASPHPWPTTGDNNDQGLPMAHATQPPGSYSNDLVQSGTVPSGYSNDTALQVQGQALSQAPTGFSSEFVQPSSTYSNDGGLSHGTLSYSNANVSPVPQTGYSNDNISPVPRTAPYSNNDLSPSSQMSNQSYSNREVSPAPTAYSNDNMTNVSPISRSYSNDVSPAQRAAQYSNENISPETLGGRQFSNENISPETLGSRQYSNENISTGSLAAPSQYSIEDASHPHQQPQYKPEDVAQTQPYNPEDVASGQAAYSSSDYGGMARPGYPMEYMPRAPMYSTYGGLEAPRPSYEGEAAPRSSYESENQQQSSFESNAPNSSYENDQPPSYTADSHTAPPRPDYGPAYTDSTSGGGGGIYMPSQFPPPMRPPYYQDYGAMPRGLYPGPGAEFGTPGSGQLRPGLGPDYLHPPSSGSDYTMTPTTNLTQQPASSSATQQQPYPTSELESSTDRASYMSNLMIQGPQTAYTGPGGAYTSPGGAYMQPPGSGGVNSGMYSGGGPAPGQGQENMDVDTGQATTMPSSAGDGPTKSETTPRPPDPRMAPHTDHRVPAYGHQHQGQQHQDAYYMNQAARYMDNAGQTGVGGSSGNLSGNLSGGSLSSSLSGQDSQIVGLSGQSSLSDSQSAGLSGNLSGGLSGQSGLSGGLSDQHSSLPKPGGLPPFPDYPNTNSQPQSMGKLGDMGTSGVYGEHNDTIGGIRHAYYSNENMPPPGLPFSDPKLLYRDPVTGLGQEMSPWNNHRFGGVGPMDKFGGLGPMDKFGGVGPMDKFGGLGPMDRFGNTNSSIPPVAGGFSGIGNINPNNPNNDPTWVKTEVKSESGVYNYAKVANRRASEAGQTPDDYEKLVLVKVEMGESDPECSGDESDQPGTLSARSARAAAQAAAGSIRMKPRDDDGSGGAVVAGDLAAMNRNDDFMKMEFSDQPETEYIHKKGKAARNKPKPETNTNAAIDGNLNNQSLTDTNQNVADVLDEPELQYVHKKGLAVAKAAAASKQNKKKSPTTHNNSNTKTSPPGGGAGGKGKSQKPVSPKTPKPAKTPKTKGKKGAGKGAKSGKDGGKNSGGKDIGKGIGSKGVGSKGIGGKGVNSSVGSGIELKDSKEGIRDAEGATEQNVGGVEDGQETKLGVKDGGDGVKKGGVRGEGGGTVAGEVEGTAEDEQEEGGDGNVIKGGNFEEAMDSHSSVYMMLLAEGGGGGGGVVGVGDGGSSSKKPKKESKKSKKKMLEEEELDEEARLKKEEEIKKKAELMKRWQELETKRLEDEKQKLRDAKARWEAEMMLNEQLNKLTPGLTPPVGKSGKSPKGKGGGENQKGKHPENQGGKGAVNQGGKGAETPKGKRENQGKGDSGGDLNAGSEAEIGELKIDEGGDQDDLASGVDEQKSRDPKVVAALTPKPAKAKKPRISEIIKVDKHLAFVPPQNFIAPHKLLLNQPTKGKSKGKGSPYQFTAPHKLLLNKGGGDGVGEGTESGTEGAGSQSKGPPKKRPSDYIRQFNKLKQIEAQERAEAADAVENPMEDNSSIALKTALTPEKFADLIKMHGGENGRYCMLCDKRFPRSDYFRKHMIQHTMGDKPHVCTECGASFPYLSRLKRHMEKHTGQKPHVCSICGKSFGQLYYLQKHLERHPPSEAGDAAAAAAIQGTLPHKCGPCGKSFIKPSELRTHMLEHGSEKPKTCKLCLTAYLIESEFHDHMRTHPEFDEDFPCTYCEQCFESYDKLQEHQLTHTGGREHVCNVCLRAFSHTSALKRHIKTHTGEKLHACKVCGKTFARADNLRGHMYTHAGERPQSQSSMYIKLLMDTDKVLERDLAREKLGDLGGDVSELMKPGPKSEVVKASLAQVSNEKSAEMRSAANNLEDVLDADLLNKPVITPDNVAEIMKMHLGEHERTCHICNRKFARADHFSKHMITHEVGDKPHVCFECGASFNYPSRLKRHMDKHTGAKPHVCSFCGKSFGQLYYLQRHLERHDTTTLVGQEGVNGATPSLPHKCDVCGQTFIKPTILRAHMATHTTEKIHHCRMCCICFASAATYHEHMNKTHPDYSNETFECTFCKEAFPTYDQMQAHQVTHTGGKEHVCNVCMKAFSHSSGLRRHMKLHTGEKFHVCKICDKSFVRADSLKGHMYTHVGERLHSCPVCNKSYTRPDDLRTHMKTHIGHSISAPDLEAATTTFSPAKYASEFIQRLSTNQVPERMGESLTDDEGKQETKPAGAGPASDLANEILKSMPKVSFPPGFFTGTVKRPLGNNGSNSPHSDDDEGEEENWPENSSAEFDGGDGKSTTKFPGVKFRFPGTKYGAGFLPGTSGKGRKDGNSPGSSDAEEGEDDEFGNDTELDPPRVKFDTEFMSRRPARHNEDDDDKDNDDGRNSREGSDAEFGDDGRDVIGSDGKRRAPVKFDADFLAAARAQMGFRGSRDSEDLDEDGEERENENYRENESKVSSLALKFDTSFLAGPSAKRQKYDGNGRDGSATELDNKNSSKFKYDEGKDYDDDNNRSNYGENFEDNENESKLSVDQQQQSAIKFDTSFMPSSSSGSQKSHKAMSWGYENIPGQPNAESEQGVSESSEKPISYPETTIKPDPDAADEMSISRGMSGTSVGEFKTKDSSFKDNILDSRSMSNEDDTCRGVYSSVDQRLSDIQSAKKVSNEGDNYSKVSGIEHRARLTNTEYMEHVSNDGDHRKRLYDGDSMKQGSSVDHNIMKGASHGDSMKHGSTIEHTNTLSDVNSMKQESSVDHDIMKEPSHGDSMKHGSSIDHTNRPSDVNSMNQGSFGDHVKQGSTIDHTDRLSDGEFMKQRCTETLSDGESVKKESGDRVNRLSDGELMKQRSTEELSEGESAKKVSNFVNEYPHISERDSDNANCNIDSSNTNPPPTKTTGKLTNNDSNYKSSGSTDDGKVVKSETVENYSGHTAMDSDGGNDGISCNKEVVNGDQ